MANGDAIVKLARSQIGKPYVFGAAGPSSFDCSGLVKYCFRNIAQIDLPHSSSLQLGYGSEITRTQLAPGDLIFPSLGHVQIYSGNGNVIEAAEPGTNVRENPIWGFWRARRLVTPGTGTTVPGDPTLTPVLDPITPLIPLFAPLFGLISEITHLVRWLVNPKNWLRIGMFSVGAILTFIALSRWANVLNTVTNAASKVVVNG